MSSSTPSRSPALSSSYLHQRTLTSSSASSASFPAPANAPATAAAAPTLTLEALIQAHNSAQDPKLAALEQAIAERNVLSSQNGQLWKLIEKQRAGYNQILKELERVRSERDSYKAKITALVSSSPERRPRKENGGQERPEDISTPRSAQPPSRQQQDIATFPSFQSNSTSTPPRQQKSSLTPLLVPPRAESLPMPSSAASSATPENAPFSHVSKLVVRNDTAPSSVSFTPSQHRQSPVASTPQTAPAGYAQPPPSSTKPYAHPPPSAVQLTHQREIQVTSPGTPTPVEPPPPVNGAMLSATGDMRGQFVSRDSRISLPDEARRYIANMGDTPVPSPQVDAFAPRPAPPPAEESEFLDLEDDGEDEVDDNDGDEEAEERDDVEDEEDDPEPAVDASVQPPRHPQLTAASDFPLPPPTVSHPSPEANTQAQAHAYHQAQERAHVQQERSYQQQQMQQQAQQQLQQSYNQSTESLMAPLQPLRPSPASTVPASFRALPLLQTDLSHTRVTVTQSFVLSFVVFVDPGSNKDGWKVEKMYSDVIALDQRVRNSVGKNVGKKMVSLPEGKLWKDHAPAKVDQRKAQLETYLQGLVNLPVKNNDEVIAFFTSDIVREYKQPVMQAGHKEGYLTKRGKNFGGWKTRFFVLQGPVLEYYDCRGGAHLGSITVTGAQIGRQQRSERPATDEEKEYRHAFLIVEAKKGPGGSHPRHVLCAESDVDRDSWVEMLVRYFSGTYSEDPVSYGQPPPSYSSGHPNGASQARPSTDAYGARPPSPARSVDYSPVDRAESARRAQPSSLPDSSPLSNATQDVSYQRANSEQGHYPDLVPNGSSRRAHSPEQHRTREGTAKGFQPTLSAVVSSPITPVAPPSQQQPSAPPQNDRAPSPEKADAKAKISGPLNGAPIPAGYKFGGKDGPAPDASPVSAATERREKAKSRSFWGFGRPGAGNASDKGPPTATFVPRAVFGVTLEESLDVAQIANLPAIVFRCIQYLEAKKADQEEGIYRLSGSSAVIKGLKDRFNMEGDIDLIGSDEYWDPHAISGLLKSFLRELPASILTHNLHLRFLAVMDFMDPQERIRELSQLIAALPIANYSLLRALTAHLIRIVQNSTVNKMTMRNVGIVFSPTLGIPAGVFSLMLGEFNRVFNVDGDTEPEGDKDEPTEASDETHRRRNSRQYSSAAADQLLGLSGRSLAAPAEEGPSDEDTVPYESETETTDNGTVESSANSSPGPGTSSSTHEIVATTKSKAMATSKGLNVSVSQSSRGNRYSQMMGLPASPRPPMSPRTVSTEAP
ncbi:hypothetical protein FB45DRAFT_925555 [Roridomyces roridus]|uniref:RhoGAP-domain-containing protein n=1 Tax=Roridomyces roridus TaxID=1738132 RepID=A0AAD7FJ34_9AGAR|nr:hypothetical protein FB45DRAFT_925555 [Roridomyces roridus]